MGGHITRMERKVKVEKTRTVHWSFLTQTALVSRLETMIAEGCLQKDQEFLLAAVNNCDKVYSKSSPATRVYSDWDDQHRYKCLYVVLENGNEFTVKKREVARAAYNADAVAARRIIDDHISTLRELVDPQIQAARVAWQHAGSPPCPMCNVKLTPDNSQVDHCGTMEFRHIRDAFGDRPLEEWCSFHEEHATLQVICKTCNLRKPKQKLIEPKHFCRIPMV